MPEYAKRAPFLRSPKKTIILLLIRCLDGFLILPGVIVNRSGRPSGGIMEAFTSILSCARKRKALDIAALASDT